MLANGDIQIKCFYELRLNIFDVFQSIAVILTSAIWSFKYSLFKFRKCYLGTSEKSWNERDWDNICTHLAPSAFSRFAPFYKESDLTLIFFFNKVNPQPLHCLHMLYHLNYQTYQLNRFSGD